MQSIDLKKIGNEIKVRRVKQGIQQTALAEMLDIVSLRGFEHLKADALSNHLFIVDINLYHPVSLPKNFIVMKDSAAV